MNETIGGTRLPPSNLFTPDFGQPPHVLVGREHLKDSILAGLEAGPSDPRYSSLLLGPRGSGKTVLLNSVHDLARASGWIVLPLDAATGGIHDRLRAHLDWVRDSYEDVPDLLGPAGRKRTSIEVSLPVLRWQREAINAVRPDWSVRRQLTELAEHARSNQVAVLLAVDELHSGPREELRRLAADLQHIIKNEQRNLAFVGAGLSELKHTLLHDKKMTFFQRCHQEDMPPMSELDVTEFLARTVRDASGTFAGDALKLLVAIGGSIPYRMQLAGDAAWRVSGAPFDPIDEDAVTAARPVVEAEFHRRIALPTWHDLNDTEQALLRAVHDAGGAASIREITAAATNRSAKSLNRAADRLISMGCLTEDANGSFGLGEVIPRESVALAIGRLRAIEQTLADNGDDGVARAQPQRCNRLMPRAKALCVLPAGHAGRCRSR